MAFAARAKTVAAATARSLPPWIVPPRPVPSGFVLERFVDLETPPARLQEEWAVVQCENRKAYGCGKHGQMVVEGLTVYARLVTSPDLTSALYIHANDDALRGIKAEFGYGVEGPLIPLDENRGFRAAASVVKTDQRFIFFSLLFHRREHGERKYYLLYDSVAASLLMIPRLPDMCRVDYTLSPLHVPLGGRYELLLWARRLVLPREEDILTLEQMQQLQLRHEDVLCVWAPPATEDESECPWQMLGRSFPEQLIQHPFAPDVMFSFGGKAFWVDLMQGMAHCDRPSPAGVKVVNFGFIPLPPGCPPDLRWTKPKLESSDFGPMTIDRTSACVSGTIRFAYIDRSRPGANVVVSVWDLDLETRVWKNCNRFLTKQLWRLWSFKKEGLPETEPKFPILMPDGTLCLLVRNKPKNLDDDLEED